jgi:predicted DNA-binding transcriptional regulator YafY
MLYAIDSEIVESILEAISEKKYLEITTISKRKQTNKIVIYPIKLYVSTQNGREYLLCHEMGGSGITFVRLDNMKAAVVKGKCENYQDFENEYESCKPYLWGVIAGNAKDITHIEMTIKVSENEEFIAARLEREKRNGHVYQLNNHQYKYVVDTYDAMELMPWIRTFIGRIEKLESTNTYLQEKFDNDMNLMYSMYLGGDGGAV